MTFLSFYYNGKIGFHVRFIKTWKGIPCISWLEVSCSKISINHRNTRMITTLLKKTPRGLRQVFTNNYINLPISLFDFDCSSLAKKKMHFIWVPMYLARKYWGHYLYVSYWRRDRHLTWLPEPRKGVAACSAKGVPSFLSYFKTLSNGAAPGIESAISCFAVQRSTDWANPVAVKLYITFVFVGSFNY